MRYSRKSQIFYVDALVGVLIFSLAVLLYFALGGNLSLSEGKVFDILISDAEAISGSLMTIGNPINWTIDNVSTIGLTDGSFRLNLTKVHMLMNMSSNDTTSLFGTNANYAIFFKDKYNNILFFNRCVFSNLQFVVQNISSSVCENFTVEDSKYLVASERLVAYNSEINNSELIKLVVYVWA